MCAQYAQGDSQERQLSVCVCSVEVGLQGGRKEGGGRLSKTPRQFSYSQRSEIFLGIGGRAVLGVSC